MKDIVAEARTLGSEAVHREVARRAAELKSAAETARGREPRLLPTPVDGVLILERGESLGIDTVNQKGQPAPDGYLTHHDAARVGISREEWSRVAEGVRLGTTHLSQVVELFQRNKAQEPPVTLRGPGGSELVVQPSRARELRLALDRIREEIALLKSENYKVVYPVVAEEGVHAASPPLKHDPAIVLIDPEDYRTLDLSADEANWLFGILAAKTERVVLFDGRAHYMTPELKERMDDRVRHLHGLVSQALDEGKKTMYLSTFLSSMDREVNQGIVDWVERKIEREFNGQVFSLNPGAQQRIPGAKGDDYMYMWETLIRMNIFHAVRFTSAEDTKEYFSSQNRPVPKDYLFEYGDVSNSAGCRYEWDFFHALSEDLAKRGLAHFQPQAFYGDDPIPMGLNAKVPLISYASRGEDNP